MNTFRHHLRIFALLLTAAFALVSVEWHADHEACAKTAQAPCSVQCCPAHHLAPAPASTPAAATLPPNPDLLVYQSPWHPDFVPFRIERPPIG